MKKIGKMVLIIGALTIFASASAFADNPAPASTQVGAVPSNKLTCPMNANGSKGSSSPLISPDASKKPDSTKAS